LSKVFDIADRYIDKMAALDPIAATAFGVPGHDHEMPDRSPEGAQAEADLDKATLTELDAAPLDNERDRIAREMMTESLRLHTDTFDAREHLRGLSMLHSPIHSTRMCFDLMLRDTEEHWSNIAARMALVPTTLESYHRTLDEGLRQGMVASKRQASETADQCDVWSGKGAGQTSFFQGLLNGFDQAGISSESLRRELVAGVEAANNAMAATAHYLRETYVPGAGVRDAVGEDRYALSAHVYNGVELDLRQTYDWGWEQLAWVEGEMASTAERILPGGGVEAAKELLESDPNHAIDGEDEFKQWMQDLQDRTISELDGTHFDIADPVKRIEALIAPPGGALAMYYTPPSEDFSRPGRTWYPTGGKTRFPLWGEVSIAYHEGVPGHHFQLATTNQLSAELSRFQRLMGGSSGYVEGWGLYAERLMAELGYLENPGYYLGMLRAQALRSARVILDIGMHLELTIPAGQAFHPGETWTPELGLEFINLKSHFPPDFVASEISRYLGLPGQAISYKVGERAWLDARAAAKERKGSAFDLKQFHTQALDLGPMGLAQMQRELARV
jgi:uncharacterized protein (DUF885 family)